MPRDEPFETLLDLDGERFVIDRERLYWVKFEAKIATPTRHRPMGIKYTLTLHDRNNNRIFGMDNAHRPALKRKHRYSPKKVAYDHIHDHGIVENYEFSTPEQLLADFWASVERILSETLVSG